MKYASLGRFKDATAFREHLTSLALQFLAEGDLDRYGEIMEPCETLSRWLFRAPTQYYKSGLAFLAWLNGLQDNAMLVNHEERVRDWEYYLRAAELAGTAGVLRDAPLAQTRLEEFGQELS